MSRFPDVGTVLAGKYLVESLIGEGGMGAVLKARHISLDAPVAVKCLLPEMMERKDVVARFVREGTSAFKLKGEHVARILDVGRLDDGVPYIAMEYLEGADLNAILKHHGRQHPAIAVDLVLQACEALAEAHALGIIHRDIKASNFFVLQPPGSGPFLKVLDFGIATAPEGASDLTSTQSVIGTPSYMAPEQMRSSRTADQRSDIWSLGVVLYELLDGSRPFKSEVYSELCLKVGMDPPEPFSVGVPDVLQAIVFRCLEKPVERRYQSVAELAYDLMPWASNPVMARATVEQCARLLGRRSTRSVDAMSAPMTAGVGPGERTPGSMPPPRLTPQPAMSSTHPKTPTSVQMSSGQMSMVTDADPLPGPAESSLTTKVSAGPMAVPRRRRGRLVGVAIGVALGGVAALAGVLVMTSNADAPRASAPSAPVSAEPASAPAVDPTPGASAPMMQPIGGAAIAADMGSGSAGGAGSGSGNGSGSAIEAVEVGSAGSADAVGSAGSGSAAVIDVVVTKPATKPNVRPPVSRPRPPTPPPVKPPKPPTPPTPPTTSPPPDDPFSHRD